MTHWIGYVLLVAAIVSLVLAFVIQKEAIVLTLGFAVAAAFFEEDYPSGL